MAQRRLKCIDCGRRLRPNGFRQSSSEFGERCPNCGGSLLGNDGASLCDHVPQIHRLNRIVYGPNDLDLDVSGFSVGQILTAVSDILNCDPTNVAIHVDGIRVGRSYIVQPGQRIEFMRERGAKGGRRRQWQVGRQTNLNDHYQTPPKAVDMLLPYLPPDWRIWECCCGQGQIVHRLEQHDYDVIGTDIMSGHDALTWQPDQFDCIVTNPPYSIKNLFIERCYAIGKPFALLLPIAALATATRQHFYKRHGVQLLIPDRRINYRRADSLEIASSSSFDSAWFTFGFDLPSELNFCST